MSFGKQVLSSIIGSSIGILLTGGVLIVLFVVALVGGLVAAFGGDDPDPFVEVEEGTVLRMTLDQPILERGAAMPFPGLDGSGGGIGLDEIRNALERAAEDDRIQGLLLDVSAVDAAPATLQEVRRAVTQFKKSGKWVVYWTEAASMSGLYLGSVADKVFLHPQGVAELAGMRLQTTFFTGMLEKLGVQVTVLRGPDNAYKGAVEPFLRKDLSPENREQLSALLEDIWGEMRREWAGSRGLSEAVLDSVASGLAWRLPVDGVRLGLIDGLKYEDELEAHLRERLGGRPIYADLTDYLLPEDFFGISLEALENWDPDQRRGPDAENRDSIALGGDVAIVYAVGGIESGEGDDVTIGSETLAESLRRARLAPDVKAVVLRVNSPGGSALASDVIWRETVLLRESGKPLVVSMGDYAASGGYYISAAATKIYAEPTTITGSIGVFGMIPNAQELLTEKMGLSFDEVSTHPHAGMGIDRPLDAVQMEAMNASIANIYDTFVSVVAAGRGMTREQVEEVARGRVWSGRDALDKGLVDALGNLEDAVAEAIRLAGLDAATVERVVMPEPVDPISQWLEEMGGVEVGMRTLAAWGVPAGTVQEFLSLQRMVQQGDRVQARLPYAITIR